MRLWRLSAARYSGWNLILPAGNDWLSGHFQIQNHFQNRFQIRRGTWGALVELMPRYGSTRGEVVKRISALQGQPQQHPTATVATAGGLGQQLSPMGFGDRPGHG